MGIWLPVLKVLYYFCNAWSIKIIGQTRRHVILSTSHQLNVHDFVFFECECDCDCDCDCETESKMWFFSRDPTSSFPYEIGETIEGLEDKSVWSLHNGKKKVSHDIVGG